MNNRLQRSFDRLLRLPPHRVGMTLVEIMIVLTIMAGIMGFAAYSVIGYLKGAKVKEATGEVAQLREFVENYNLMNGSYPDDLNDLAEDSGMGQVTERVPMDPWDNEYQYVQERNHFVIFSMGPDGQTGGVDDIYPEGWEPE